MAISLTADGIGCCLSLSMRRTSIYSCKEEYTGKLNYLSILRPYYSTKSSNIQCTLGESIRKQN